jgi:hypothetical protein
MVKAKIKQLTENNTTRYEGMTIKYKSSPDKKIPKQNVFFFLILILLFIFIQGGTECGVFLLAYAYCIAAQLPLSCFCQEDSIHFRRKIFVELMNQQILFREKE